MRLPLLAGLVAALPQVAPAQPAAWVDPSPHETRLVAVAPDVRLEVLDWGGAGTPMVLLTGLGNSAHVYDEFAPRFRDAFHVYGITRRGFGASSRPDDGYDLRTRVADIVAVLDSLGVGRAVLVGHSLAGDEMSELAVAHPGRVHALVYLDAYDYGPEFGRMRDEVPDVPPATPPMTAADSASVASFMAYRERTAGVAYPEGEIRAHTTFDAGGRFAGFVPRPHRQVGAGVGIHRSEYARIAAPALAVYADVASPRQYHRFYDRLGPTDRATADSAFARFSAWRRSVVERFRAELRGGTVVELPDADHYVFLSDADEVERLVRAFLLQAAERR